MKNRIWGLIAALSLAGILGITTLLSVGPSLAVSTTDGYSVYYVAPGGNCGGMTPCFSTIQAAVDAVDADGETVKVAQGVYTDMHAVPVPSDYRYPPPSGIITQMVYVSKTLTLQGGYQVNDWNNPNPALYTTTLDAQGQGRVIVIYGQVSPTIAGFHIINGSADELGGTLLGDGGGGICSVYASPTIRQNVISGNYSGDNGGAGTAPGGGLFIAVGGNVVVISNTIQNNVATWDGGGLSMHASHLDFSGNVVISNAARDDEHHPDGFGGGIALWQVEAMIANNTFVYNSSGCEGGGLWILNSNVVSNVVLAGNLILSNTTDARGGGIFLGITRNVTTQNNVFAYNRAAYGTGGAVFVGNSWLRSTNDTFVANIDRQGAAISFPENGVSGVVYMTNTIIASQTIGFMYYPHPYLHPPGEAWITLNGILWHNVITPVVLAERVYYTVTNEYYGDPAFAADGYHLTAGSAALDRGVPTSVLTDVDGEPRPTMWGYDLGADEYSGAGLRLQKEASQFAVNPGQMITYHLNVTRIGTPLAAPVLLTDTLPVWQQLQTLASNRGTCTVEGRIIHCDLGVMDAGDSARLTMTVQVTTVLPSNLPLLMHNVVTATTTGAGLTTSAETVLQNCHVRLNSSPVEYTSVQAAVDASSSPTDIVKIAGVCAGVNNYGGSMQQVYLTRTLTLRGGYTPVNWDTPDPQANPTILHALGLGRVFVVKGAIRPTIDGLHIMGGVTGNDWRGYGGGIELRFAYENEPRLTVVNSLIAHNRAYRGGGIGGPSGGLVLSMTQVMANESIEGGGVWLRYGPTFVLRNSVVSGNRARRDGGGLYVETSADIRDSVLDSNWSGGSGGGAWLGYNPTFVLRSVVSGNRAQRDGGGLYVESSADIRDSVLDSNWSGGSGGGGVVAVINFTGNVVSGNIALRNGGVALAGSGNPGSMRPIANNLFLNNQASQECGGLRIGYYPQHGYLLLTNNVIRGNRAGKLGSGACISAQGPFHFLHNTLADNSGGQGIGLSVDALQVWLTNTIVSDQAIGIDIAPTCKVTTTGILWHNTAVTIAVSSTATSTVSNQYYGDPAFAADGYHLTAGSAALNRGVPTNVLTDIDGEPRLIGPAPDLGADEFQDRYQVYLPLVMRGH